jgi:hypothetical protein
MSEGEAGTLDDPLATGRLPGAQAAGIDARSRSGVPLLE